MTDAAHRLGQRWTHRAALAAWWFMYRDPPGFAASEHALERRQQVEVGITLAFHLLPYVLVFMGSAHSLYYLLPDWPGSTLDESLRRVLGLFARSTVGFAFGAAFSMVRGLTGALALGLSLGLGVASTRVISRGAPFVQNMHLGLLRGLAFGLAVGVAIGLARVLATGLQRAFTVGLAGGLGAGLAFGLAGGFTTGFFDDPTIAIVLVLAFLFTFLRAYYWPIHLWFVFPYPRGERYPLHPVAWDHGSQIEFWRLDRLLVAYAEHAPEAALAEIERLISGYPSQRAQALRARTILLAREAANAQDFGDVLHATASLPQGQRGYLAEVPRLRELVNELATQDALAASAATPLLREARTTLLRQRIGEVREALAGFQEPLASEFRSATTAWIKLTDRQIRDAQARAADERVPQLFRAGDPVRRDEEAFIVRDDVVSALAQEIELATGCPGIVLYGRRRVGKSSVLRNLQGFLSDTVAPVYISLQSADAFASLPHFMGKVVREIERAAQLPYPAEPEPRDLAAFERSLEQLNTRLCSQRRRALICLDEYENIDLKLSERVFSADLLAVVRESIQFHRHLIWLFAGSHEISDLRHADWTSYLVSVRTVEVPRFTRGEMRVLLNDPMQHSRAWDERERRPQLTGFWSDASIERIYDQTGGWPHFVQLVAQEAVTHANRSGASHLDEPLLDSALESALVAGHNVFYELLNKESDARDEWDYLSGFSRCERQPIPPDQRLRRALLRRQLVTERDGSYELSAAIMGRWLRVRGDVPWHGDRARA